VRKIPAALAVLTLAVVGLTGCSMPGSSDCSRPAVPDQAVMDHITVTGSSESAPHLDAYTPFHTKEMSFEDAIVGKGTPITSEKQLVVVDATIFSGKTGEKVIGTTYSGDLTAVIPVSSVTRLFPGIGDALHCATEGSRVVVALPPGGLDASTAANYNVSTDDSTIAVIDLRKVYLPAANGSNVYNSGTGLPAVVRAPDGRPGVVVPDGAPPTHLQIQTIKKGDGPAVTGDQPVRLHYTGVDWKTKTVVETTWDGQAKSVNLTDEMPGLAEALKGAAVGSQIMVVIPPHDQGGKAPSGVAADSTLVYVVDVLGLDGPGTQNPTQ
jgi:peptidylprolyl isomerase